MIIAVFYRERTKPGMRTGLLVLTSLKVKTDTPSMMCRRTIPACRLETRVIRRWPTLPKRRVAALFFVAVPNSCPLCCAVVAESQNGETGF